MPARQFPWEEIRRDFVIGRENLRELAERYGCSYHTLRHRSARELWSRIRAQHRHEVDTRAREFAIVRDAVNEAERLIDHLECSRLMHAIAVESLRRVLAAVEGGEMALSPDESRRFAIAAQALDRGIPTDESELTGAELDRAIETALEDLARMRLA